MHCLTIPNLNNALVRTLGLRMLKPLVFLLRSVCKGIGAVLIKDIIDEFMLSFQSVYNKSNHYSLYHLTQTVGFNVSLTFGKEAF